jgi:3-deoxy-7-phosphoheptulonate synthase
MRDVINQIRDGNHSVVGLMVESFLEAGSQPIPQDPKDLRYGCSVTDPCVSWETTVEMIRAAREVLRGVLPGRDRSS